MIGKQIGNYKILKELGRGGMGVVYKANQVSLGRMVAMKVLPQHLTTDPSFIKRFENEARAIAKLNHPNIVQIYDIGHEEQTYYYTMEFIEGVSLDEIIYKEGFLSLDRSINIILQVAKALRYAHSRGVIHRDIKPSNIMIDRSSRIKVADFGLALQERVTRLTVSGSIVGTPEYMSPEQAAAEAATARSDIYSLGVVFYELLTGKVPFEGESALLILKKIQTAEPEWPRSINPDIPIEAEKIIRNMMAKNPRDRYGSCQQLIQDIRRLKIGQPISTRRRRPAFALSAAGLIGLLLAGILIAYMIFGGSEEKPDIPGALEINTTPDFKSPGGIIDVSAPPLTRDSPPENISSPVSPEEMISETDGRLQALEERLRDLRAQRASPDDFWSDRLIFKKGNRISCEIISESLEKFRIRTASGVAEIPRDEIRLALYGTPEEEKAAQAVRSEEQQRLQEEQRIRSEIGALVEKRRELVKESEKETEPEQTLIQKPLAKLKPAASEDEPPPAKSDSQSPQNNEGSQRESEDLPQGERSWRVLSDCGKKAGVSFENDIITVSTNQQIENSPCSITLKMTGATQGVLSSIEILAEVNRLIFAPNEKVVSSFLVTFKDGKSIEYVLFDSQQDWEPEEVQETPGRLRIKRLQSLILLDRGWHSIMLPVAEDAVKIKTEGKVDSISLVHTQLESNGGQFLFRYKAVVPNAS